MWFCEVGGRGGVKMGTIGGGGSGGVVTLRGGAVKLGMMGGCGDIGVGDCVCGNHHSDVALI